MRYLSMLLVFFLFSCAPTPRPATLNENPMAYATSGLGNVKASASKWPAEDKVCFDIALALKKVLPHEAKAENWKLAWRDQDNELHPLNVNRRDPSSVPATEEVLAPYGAYKEWTNTFRTCAPTSNPDNVRSLLLTPRSLSIKDNQKLELTW